MDALLWTEEVGVVAVAKLLQEIAVSRHIRSSSSSESLRCTENTLPFVHSSLYVISCCFVVQSCV